jgi:hypothetical protein
MIMNSKENIQTFDKELDFEVAVWTQPRYLPIVHVQQ